MELWKNTSMPGSSPSATSFAFSILEFGAVGDGHQDDTEAFERALEAISNNGGGRLLVIGSSTKEVVYKIRPINLTSHLELVLEAGVRLEAIPDESTWPIIPPLPSYGQGRDHPGPRRTSLIHGEHIVNVTIRGMDANTSIIDGNGWPWWQKRWNHAETITRGSLIEFQYSQDIRLFDLRFQNSPFWTVHPYDCDGVHIRNVHIRNPPHSPNTDGFDPDSSQNVLIEDSSYEGGDDCVAIKSGWDCYGISYGRPSVNIHVRNLTCLANQMSLGSEMSGGIEHVLIEQVRFPNWAWHVAKLKTGALRGGYMRNITVRDVSVTGTLRSSALKIDMTLYNNAKGRNPLCPSDWRPPHDPIVQDLFFFGWNGTTANVTYGAPFMELIGMNGSPIETMILHDLWFPPSTADPSSLWVCSNLHNATARNHSIAPWPPCPEIDIFSSGNNEGNAPSFGHLSTPYQYTLLSTSHFPSLFSSILATCCVTVFIIRRWHPRNTSII